MKIFILLTLIAIGAEAFFFKIFDPWYQWGARKSKISRVNNDYHQNKFSKCPQQNNSELNFYIDQSITNAEWICKNPKTGATLIMTLKKEDQTTRPFDFFFPNSEEKEAKHNLNQENTNTKPNNVKNNGGEGSIDIRFG